MALPLLCARAREEEQLYTGGTEADTGGLELEKGRAPTGRGEGRVLVALSRHSTKHLSPPIPRQSDQLPTRCPHRDAFGALEMPFLRQPPAMFHLTAHEETPPRGQTGQGLRLCPLSVPTPRVRFLSVCCMPSARLGTVQNREEQKEGLFWKLCRSAVGTLRLSGLCKESSPLWGHPGTQLPCRARARGGKGCRLKGWSAMDVS